ncbi:unnamed protein product [Rotaria socialis]|uniref:DHHA2 domain-containing protein n=1 Tax=Rotaria socialis TaxID=392032 RepID=A0A817P0R4_9BILA|nr:unnamed protein product [Rotaria socialis]CAF4141941.1 unnamed protein product [Rotaria socialis]
MNFTDYLNYVKSQLTDLVRFRLIRIVLGNEACDLDSTISACIYAYFLHSTCQTNNEVLHVPMLQIKSSIFTEIRWFLKEHYSNMIFIDSINLSDLYKQEKFEIVLVDHHSLRSKLNQVFVSKVKIEHVGSCCTLIAEKIFASNANFHVTDEIAYLLTGSILFGTLNFSSNAGKATKKDKQIYEQLLTCQTSRVDDFKLYKDLRQSTADITGMSIQDLLQKDAKQVAGPNMRLLISSLPSEYTVEKLIGELKTMKDMDEFLSKNDNADGVIILSLETHNDEIKRQLGFYAKKFEHMLPINEYIQREEHNLSLRERGIPINQARIKLFEQRNVQASSKEILPLIEQFIKDFAPQNSS